MTQLTAEEMKEWAIQNWLDEEADEITNWIEDWFNGKLKEIRKRRKEQKTLKTKLEVMKEEREFEKQRSEYRMRMWEVQEVYISNLERVVRAA